MIEQIVFISILNLLVIGILLFDWMRRPTTKGLTMCFGTYIVIAGVKYKIIGRDLETDHYILITDDKKNKLRIKL